MISLWFALMFPPKDYDVPVAVEAAYVVTTYTPPAPKCCGLCRNGKIIHGDGHVTECACPPGCKCKPAKECKKCLPSR